MAVSCVWCTGEFEAVRPNQVYCTATCRRAAKYQRGKNAAYARPAHPERPCIECGTLFSGGTLRRRYCSDACRYAFRYKRQKLDGYYELTKERKRAQYVPTGRPPGSMRTQPLVCVVDGCDAPTIALNKCVRHYRAQRRAEGHPAYQGGGRGHYRQRARRHGVDYLPINKREIFERDGWRCGICGKRVSRSARYPDPMSASLDHIVPVSLGGAHVPGNVQLAHLICNNIKADSLAGAQPALF